MMNIIQIQDDLKNFSENQLINEMQRPSGSAPQFLVLSEINRRRRVKSEFDAANMRDEPSVAQEAVASAGVPAQGIMGMQRAMAPRSESSLSAPIRQGIGMKQGGDITRTIEYLNASSDKTRKELDDIAKKIELNQDNPFASFDKEIEAKKKEISDFSKMGTKDFSKMSMEELLETRNRMRDLGIGKKEGGVVYAREGLSLGERNFNYGNIRPGAGFIGETGANKGYATFKNPLYGGRAVSRLIDTYKNQYGINTIDDFIDRYAPAGDNTKEAREGYKKFLSDKTGLGISEAFDLETDRANLMQGIFEFETGKKSPFSQQDINAMITSSKLNDPDEVAGLLEPSTASDDGGIMTAAASGFKFPSSVNMGDRKKPFNKDLESNLLNLIKASKNNPMALRGYAQQYYGKSTNAINKALEDAGFNPDVIPKGISTSEDSEIFTSGLTKGNQPVISSPALEYDPSVEEMGDKSAIKSNILAMLSEDERKFLTTPSASLIKQPGGIKQKTKTKLEEKTGDSTFRTDAEILDDELAVIGGVSEKPKKPLPPTTSKKAPTLDDQLIAMQEELKKGREQDKWLAIAQAGLSIMASDKPTLAGAVGEGAGVGLQAYRDAQERYQEGVVDILNARAKLKGKSNTFSRKDALSAINSYNTQITKLRTDREAYIGQPEKIKELDAAISNLEFQKAQLLPFAGIIARPQIDKATYMSQ